MSKFQVNISKDLTGFDGSVTAEAILYFKNLKRETGGNLTLTKISEISGVERNRLSRLLYAIGEMDSGLVKR